MRSPTVRSFFSIELSTPIATLSLSLSLSSSFPSSKHILTTTRDYISSIGYIVFSERKYKMEHSPSSKRQREETQLVVENDCDESKKHKSYTHILSLLESEEEESAEDLSPFMTTLQKELSADSNSSLQELDGDQGNPFSASSSGIPLGYNSASSSFPSSPNSTTVVSIERDQKLEHEQERVIKHLLEASDDELGISSVVDDELVHVGEVGLVDGGGGPSLLLHDALWDLDDQAWLYNSLI